MGARGATVIPVHAAKGMPPRNSVSYLGSVPPASYHRFLQRRFRNGVEMVKMNFGQDNALRDASVPMVSVMRGEEADAAHQGIACLVDSGGKILWALGQPLVHAFFRSCAKPLQAMALLASGASDAAGLDDRDLAIICGSHA